MYTLSTTSQHWQRIVFFIFSLLTTAVVCLYLSKVVSLDDLINILTGIHLPWVALFAFLSLCMSVLRTWRYQVVLNAAGHSPGNLALFLITIVRNLFSDLLPARLGTLIYIYLVQARLGIPFGAAAASFAYAFIFDMLALASLAIPAILFTSTEGIPPAFVLSIGTFLLLSSLLTLYALPVLLQWTKKIFESKFARSIPFGKSISAAADAFQANIRTAQKQGIFWIVFALSLGVRCCKYISLYVLLLALVAPLGFLTQDFPLAKVFLGLCSAELAASLPISGIAGFGAYEGAWALVFQLLGYSQQTAALTGISHHLLTQIYGYGLGVFALVLLLLPLYKQSGSVHQACSARNKLFWPKYIGTIGLMTLTGVLLYQTGLPEQAGSGTTPPAPAAALLVSTPGHPGLPAGRLVYQRKDGIYVTAFGQHPATPRRVSSSGSKPRWSPQGNSFAYLDLGRIMLHDLGKNSSRSITSDIKTQTLCFHPDGRSLFFSNGKWLKEISLDSGKVSQTFKAPSAIKEISVSADGNVFAMTVKTRFGFEVHSFDQRNKHLRKVARGCSANVNPEGTLVSVLNSDHTRLVLYATNTLVAVNEIRAPGKGKFDNQIWTNHRHWLTSVQEGKEQNVYLHDKTTGRSYQLTDHGGCIRADAHLELPEPGIQ